MAAFRAFDIREWESSESRFHISDWVRDAHRSYLILTFLIDVLVVGLFSRTFFATAREALTMFWRILGYQYFMYACILPIEIACGVRFVRWAAWLRLCIYLLLGSVFLYPRARERAQAALSRQGSAINVASLIAECLGGDADSDHVRRNSRSYFRYVYLKDLAFDEMVAATSGTRSQEVFVRTHPALLGEVDAFVSHSWHDEPRAKWDALQAWCNGFHAKHGRPPKLWLDFCCIDQNNIEASLSCLPVFLSGCKKLLLIAGASYARRLWCAIELFVFVSIHQTTSCESLEVALLGKTAAERSSVGESFKSFDVMRCECSVLEDQQRLQGVVEAGSGTAENFNAQIRRMLGGIKEADSEESQV
jgi:hypothetical protein